MTVRVNKDSFNLREKLSELERPIGLKGSELMKSETVQEARDFISAGRRNLCINGNFKCWQRATSIASGASGNGSNAYKYVSADRWQTYYYNTYARQDVVLPNGEKVYAMRETMQVTRNFLGYIIEDGGRIWNQGGDITISFWARTSGPSTGVSLGYYWHDSWAGSAYTHDGPRKNIIIEGSEWKHYSVTKKLNVNANNRASLAIEFDNNAYGSWRQLASGEYWEFANVQIEKSSVATDFEQRSLGEELALCQRYYQSTNRLQASSIPLGQYGESAYTGWQYDSNAGSLRIRLPVEMRVGPTATVVGSASASPGADGTIGAYGDNGWMTLSSITATAATPLSIRINTGGMSGAGKDAFGLYFYGTYLTSTIKLDAEL